MIALLLIDPEGRAECDAGVGGSDDVLDDLVWSDSKIGCLDPVDHDVNGRIIQALRNSNIDCAVYLPYFIGDGPGDLLAHLKLTTGDLNIDRGRQTKVECCCQYAASIEGELDTRESLGESISQKD